MFLNNTVLSITLLLSALSAKLVFSTSWDDFLNQRTKYLREEAMLSVGSMSFLNANESAVNDILMNYKTEEIQRGFRNISEFLPSSNFLRISREMENRTMFKLLQLFPKGAALHGHNSAMVSSEYLVKNLTYRENLYAKFDDDNENIVELRFLNSSDTTDWISVETIRKNKGDDYDDWMIKQLTLHEAHAGLGVNEIWSRFQKLFSIIKPLIHYAPVWQDHIYQMLKEFHEDNVSYLEFRTSFPKIYYLNGTTLNATEVCGKFVEVLNNFKKDYPTFYGAKIIYARHRLINNEKFLKHMETARQLKQAFPDVIAGFDLVGQEDMGEPLETFLDDLFKLKNEINFFFHAGETKWNGPTTIKNLVDAVLLGTKRIGHGYAITKHPKVATMVKKYKIGIEVCPISNQVLGLVGDLRNHPLSSLLMDNYPVVISSDDPGYWGAKGVTYDWYETFIGIAAFNQDVHLLRKLALNSIEQSSLTDDEKQELKEDWKKRWNSYIELILKTYRSDSNAIETSEDEGDEVTVLMLAPDHAYDFSPFNF
ncbi:adenosine deaminase 2-like [Ctenocephalides felis]|uniref:adenosine deaminase 2-like n=1 Tax=Ctenocephalides felis TaxID=7515 RepID=UPI000E6E3CDD|nr:adenosine deaminase 2-like [Ctenocephalides felis]